LRGLDVFPKPAAFVGAVFLKCSLNFPGFFAHRLPLLVDLLSFLTKATTTLVATFGKKARSAKKRAFLISLADRLYYLSLSAFTLLVTGGLLM
jgi:hypothetical protein